MTGNTLGYHLGNLTKHLKENLLIAEEIEREKKKKEIENSQLIWSFTIDYLKKIDTDFEKFYRDDIPDYIYWTGEKFQDVLKILWNRINHINKKV